MILAIRYVFASCPLRITLLIAVVLLQGLIPGLNVFMTGQIINTLHDPHISNDSLLLNVGIWCLSLLGTQLMQPVVNLVQGDVTEISTNHFSVQADRDVLSADGQRQGRDEPDSFNSGSYAIARSLH